MSPPSFSCAETSSSPLGKRGQRCLVITDGYYEWKVLDPKGKKKQPYAIAMADDREMVMAGLWETWKSPTTRRRNLDLHDYDMLAQRGHRRKSMIRMPVILDEADWPKWLGEERPRRTSSTRC